MALSEESIFLKCKMLGKRHGGKLHNWHQFSLGDISVIFANISEDTNWGNRHSPFKTSQVVDLNEDEGYVETMNTLYELGEKGTRKDANTISSQMYGLVLYPNEPKDN